MTILYWTLTSTLFLSVVTMLASSRLYDKHTKENVNVLEKLDKIINWSKVISITSVVGMIIVLAIINNNK